MVGWWKSGRSLVLVARLSCTLMTFTKTNLRDLAGIRHAIEEHIVGPIEDLCSHTFWSNKPDPQERDCTPFSIGNLLNKPVVSDRVPTISAVDNYVPTLFREVVP